MRNAKEAHFKKHETSSYSFCMLKVMFQESWPHVCLAALSEMWSVVWTSGSLPGRFDVVPVPPLHGLRFGEGMTLHGDVCAFPAAERGSENFGQAKWQLENVLTHSLQQKQTLFTAQLPFVFLLFRSIVFHVSKSNSFTLATFSLVWIVVAILLRFPIHEQS